MIDSLRSRGGLVTLVSLALLVAAGVGVVLLSQTVGGSDMPKAAPPFAAPPGAGTVALNVKSRAGSTVTAVEQKGGNAVQRDIQIPESAKIERLRPIRAADVQPGDFVTAIGIKNEYKNFAIHSIVVHPAGTGTPIDGVLKSGAGFYGHEVAKEAVDRPVFGGVVIRVSGDDLILTGPTGEAIVTASPGGRLYRLEAATVSDIAEGDRIAGAFNPGPAAAVLVVPFEG
jgi:hypothetical protein